MITEQGKKELYIILDEMKEKYQYANFMWLLSKDARRVLLYACKDDEWKVDEAIEDEFEYKEVCLDGQYDDFLFVVHDSCEEIIEGVEILEEIVEIVTNKYSR